MTPKMKRMAATGVFSLSACLITAGCAGSGDSADGGETKKVAYLEASSANTFLQAADKGIREIADENDVEVVNFDAQFKPGEQSKQIQDIIANGTYDGIIIATADGIGVAPDIEQAIAEGIEVVVLNQVVGTELNTPDPQVEGVTASVLMPPVTSGERLGELVVQACADLDPCRVVYFFGIKGSPGDTGIRQGFDATVASTPAVQIIAEAEGKFLGPEEGIKETEDIIQSGKEFDVVVGADQSMQGVELALKDAGITTVKIVGQGGSEPAVAAIKDGRWFGGLAALPITEGKLSMEAMLAAFNGDPDFGGVDPGDDFPGGVLLTQENVDEFTPQYAG